MLSTGQIIPDRRPLDHAHRIAIGVLTKPSATMSGSVLTNGSQLLRSHRIMTGPRREAVAGVAGVAAVVQEAHTQRQSTLLVRTDGPILDPAWSLQEPGLEELVLAYLGQPEATALPSPRLAPTGTGVSR